MSAKPTADRKRPDFAEEPGAGQESVWDYPRPPAIRWDGRPIEVRDGEARIDDLEGHVAFYAGRVDCYLGGELVRSQAGRFYGGWITSDVVGPFKGEPGTGHW